MCGVEPSEPACALRCAGLFDRLAQRFKKPKNAKKNAISAISASCFVANIWTCEAEELLIQFDKLFIHCCRQFVHNALNLAILQHQLDTKLMRDTENY